MDRQIRFPDGETVPAIGQGTWFLGDNKEKAAQEKEALIAGVEVGMTLIDTAEMYGEGRAERFVGQAVRELDRASIFLVSKVYPHNAGRERIFKSCEASLERMGTTYLDLYLLHWRGPIPLEETVACMEELKKRGLIRRWGVSNFDIDDMRELWNVPGGKNCATNQVLYHIASRGIEYSLLPWLAERYIPVMGYCPLAQGGGLHRGLYGSVTLNKIAANHDATVAQILLAFAVRGENVVAIPRSGQKQHALSNAAAGGITLTEEELRLIDREFPAPKRKTALDIV